MYSFKSLLDLTEKEFDALELPASPRLLYDPIRYAVADGGKRIRPVAALMAYNLFQENLAPAIPAAMAVELFHNFTLLHDDIMDQAPTRRGKPAVYKQWDENVAILSGDVMLIYVYQLLAQSAPDKLPELIKIFNTVAIGVCEGQSYDMYFETRNNVTTDEYLAMIELKTAILLAGAFRIGAFLGGASKKMQELFYRFGINVGLAFQIQDDLLDTYSDEATLGKPIGGDILESKKTFLLTTAFAKAGEQEREKLLALLQDSSIPGQKKIEEVRRIYDQLGVSQVAQESVRHYFNEAYMIMEEMEFSDDSLVPLREFLQIVLRREK